MQFYFCDKLFYGAKLINIVFDKNRNINLVFVSLILFYKY